MFQKFSFALCSLLFVLFSVSPVLAADPNPQANPLCWTKENCEAQIKANGWDFTEELNWLEGEPNGECGSWGGCIPAGQTQLSIAVGDQNKPIANLGDYIKKIYLYLVGIGGLIATVLIIKGGFEWTTSAGNPTRITSAKSSITSALLGLFLLLGSYTLLYTINPDLLRLKLPRVFMVRALTLGGKWCKDLPNPAGQKFALAQLDSSKELKEFKDIKLDDFTIAFPAQQSSAQEDILTEAGQSNPETAMPCGARYYSLDGQDQTCAAHFCDKSSAGKQQVCMEIEKDKYACKETVLSGTITGAQVPYPFVKDVLSLMMVCINEEAYNVYTGVVKEVEKDKSQRYYFAGMMDVGEIEGKVTSRGGDCGFYILAQINEAGVAFADRYAIGKSGTCNVNLLQKVGWKGKWELNAVSGYMYNTIKPFLLTIDDLKNGAPCDMPLSRTDFPPL